MIKKLLANERASNVISTTIPHWRGNFFILLISGFSGTDGPGGYEEGREQDMEEGH